MVVQLQLIYYYALLQKLYNYYTHEPTVRPLPKIQLPHFRILISLLLHFLLILS